MVVIINDRLIDCNFVKQPACGIVVEQELIVEVRHDAGISIEMQAEEKVEKRLRRGTYLG
jgi:hypothetical protein